MVNFELFSLEMRLDLLTRAIYKLLVWSVRNVRLTSLTIQTSVRAAARRSKNDNGFVANLWRDNKPGFLILSLLLIAMLGSIGYYLYSRTGQFVVTVERISRDEALDIYTKAALKTYCREFRSECSEQGEDNIENEIRRVLPKILSQVKSIPMPKSRTRTIPAARSL